MRKRLRILAIAVFAAVFISCQPNKAAEAKHLPAKQIKAESDGVGANEINKQPSSQTNQSGTSEHSPSGNANAEGAKIWWRDPSWALVLVGILTAGVIGWQAVETRRAAQASQSSAEAALAQADISRKSFISQFRPRIPIRSIWLLEEDGALVIEIWLTNRGETSAHIIGSDIRIGWEIPRELKKIAVASAVFEPISLSPGRDHSVSIDVTEKIAGPFNLSKMCVDEMGREQEAWILCLGHVIYRDDANVYRSTAFFRRYDLKSKRFIAAGDPEDEFCD
jgi:hypothetical protein